VTRRLFIGPMEAPVARISSSGTAAWYLTDNLCSVRVLTANTGAVIDEIDYDAYGDILNQTNAAVSDRYLWTGQQFDSVTGLQFNRARYYDPATGRWTTEDPLGFAAGDTNLYRYVQDQPTRFTDPSGLVEQTEVAGLVKDYLDKILQGSTDSNRANFALGELLEDKNEVIRKETQSQIAKYLAALPSVPNPGAKELDQIPTLFEELDDKNFATRQAAQEKLYKLGPAALPAIEKQLQAEKLPLEFVRRLETLQFTIKRDNYINTDWTSLNIVLNPRSFTDENSKKQIQKALEKLANDSEKNEKAKRIFKIILENFTKKLEKPAPGCDP
jgi:RHS repeat-associated protein